MRKEDREGRREKEEEKEGGSGYILKGRGFRRGAGNVIW